MNHLIATDAYHLTMGYLIQPERALECESHVLYARSGGPLVVSELSLVLRELLDWRLDKLVVDEAEAYWKSMGVPFARDAWDSVVAMTAKNGLPFSVRGVRDGEVVLPGDPIAVFEAPAILAAVIEPWLIARMAKSLQLATRFTKLAQAVDWDYGRLFEVGLRASHSIADHNDSIRILKKAGLRLTSSGAAAAENSLLAGGSMGHRYTQRFANDYEAFDNALKRMLSYKRSEAIRGKVKLSLLLDTRSTLESGIPAALRLIQKRKQEILHDIDLSVRLDSGDLHAQLQILIKAIKTQVQDPLLWPTIVIESGLTANMVSQLERIADEKRYPLSKLVYGIGGYLVSRTDRDFISLVYKLSNISDRPVMKFADEASRGKESYPGRVTLLEHSLTRGVRRLIGQANESASLSQLGWHDLFVDLVKNGKLLINDLNADQLLKRIRSRWITVALGYNKDEKYPAGKPVRPQFSPVTRRIVDWLETYRLDSSGYEKPEISYSINHRGKWHNRLKQLADQKTD